MEGQIRIKKIAVNLNLESCDDTILATTEVTQADNIEKYEYQIDSGNWKEGSATHNFIVPSRGNHTVKVRVTAGSKTAETSKEIDMPYSEAVNIYGKAIPLSSCNPNGLYKVEHNDGPVNWQKTEYRFAGVNYTNSNTFYVHNYIRFNDEIWRIIGLVNVKTKEGNVDQRLKIVRTDGVTNQNDFGSYPWNSGNSNDWTKASLKKLLNGDYYNNNQGENKFPKGLDAAAKEMIDGDVTWTLGGTANYNNITVTQFYEYERGTTVYDDQPTEWTLNDDEAEHKGVGLIYPSDYGYATNGGSKGREECFKEALYNWPDGDYQPECANNDWLKPSSSMWTIMQDSGFFNLAFIVESIGDVVGYGSAYEYNVVWPVVYLKTSIQISGGEGTFDNPYILS